MPAWTLSTLVSRATQALGNRGDIALSDASFWANVAQEQVWNAIPHDAKEGLATSSTTSGGDKVALPSDFFELIQLSNLSLTPYLPMNPIGSHELDSWVTTMGAPTHFALYSTWLELRPRPDSNYSLQMRYMKQLSDMTVLSAPVSVATRFGYGVFLKTKELLAENVLKDTAAMMEAQQEYLAFMTSQTPDNALRLRQNRFVGVGLPRQRWQTPESWWPAPFDRSD